MGVKHLQLSIQYEWVSILSTPIGIHIRGVGIFCGPRTKRGILSCT